MDRKIQKAKERALIRERKRERKKKRMKTRTEKKNLRAVLQTQCSHLNWVPKLEKKNMHKPNSARYRAAHIYSVVYGEHQNKTGKQDQSLSHVFTGSRPFHQGHGEMPAFSRGPITGLASQAGLLARIKSL